MSYFHIGRLHHWGLVLIFLHTFFPLYAMVYYNDLLVRVVCGLYGIGIGGFAALIIFAQMTNSVMVTRGRITFRHNLIRRSVLFEKGMEFEMRTDTIDPRPRGRRGHPLFKVEIWLMSPSLERCIFDFNGHKHDQVLLERLGKQLRATIDRHIE